MAKFIVVGSFVGHPESSLVKLEETDSAYAAAFCFISDFWASAHLPPVILHAIVNESLEDLLPGIADRVEALLASKSKMANSIAAIVEAASTVKKMS